MPVSRCSAAGGGFALGPGERRPALELRRAADRRREAEGDIVGERIGVRLQPVQRIDARVGLRQQRPQALALADLGDEEDAAAGGVERRRDRLDAKAVAVGLDHRGAIARRGAARQLPPIVGQRRDVDGQDRRGVRLRRLGVEATARPGVAKLSHHKAFCALSAVCPAGALLLRLRRALFISLTESARWTNSSLSPASPRR